MIERMSAEFGEWLRTIDMAQIMSKLLEETRLRVQDFDFGEAQEPSERAPELSLADPAKVERDSRNDGCASR